MKILNKYALSALLAVGLSFNASALNITPDNPPPVLTGTATANPTIQNEIKTFVATTYGCDISLVYKQDQGQEPNDTGAFASSYSTVFLNPSNDPSGATVTYNGGPFITGEQIFLLVKDGNQTPSYYFFDISSWNGTETLNLSGFWPQQGAISYVALYTCPDGDGNAVPEGGATLALLGIAIGGLGFLKRKFLTS
jgi:hypothetical protein